MPDPDERRYEVTGQDHTQELLPTGQFEHMARINFRSHPSGTHSYIEVARHNLDPEHVHELISKEHHRIEDVHKLGRHGHHHQPPQAQQ